jgi:hypothetical protein
MKKHEKNMKREEKRGTSYNTWSPDGLWDTIYGAMVTIT